MRAVERMGCLSVSLAALALAAWLLGLGDAVREAAAGVRALDWAMGGLCLLWLIVILKVPWDLYLQAHEAAFELRRSRERALSLADGRESEVAHLRRRLGWVAVGAHLASAALVAGVSALSGGTLGYYFAGFYLVATLFRPAGAVYVFLSRRLRAIVAEARYPREDIVEVRQRLGAAECEARRLREGLDGAMEAHRREAEERAAETRQIRESVHAIGRELETTVSRLTDNQEVIRGIQAFVRLVSQSAQP